MATPTCAQRIHSLENQVIFHPKRTFGIATLVTALTIIGMVGALLMGVGGPGVGLFIPCISLFYVELGFWVWMVLTYRQQKKIEEEYEIIHWSNPEALEKMKPKLSKLAGGDEGVLGKLLELFGTGLEDFAFEGENGFTMTYQGIMMGSLKSGRFFSLSVQIDKKIKGTFDLGKRTVWFNSGLQIFGKPLTMCRITRDAFCVKPSILGGNAVPLATVKAAKIAWR